MTKHVRQRIGTRMLRTRSPLSRQIQASKFSAEVETELQQRDYRMALHFAGESMLIGLVRRDIIHSA